MFIITKWTEPEVKQYTSGNIVVGAGYSSDSQQVVSQVCYNATVSSTSAQQGYVQLDTALSFSELENKLGISVSISGKYGMFSTDAKASYIRSVQDKDYSISLNYYEYATNNVAVQLAGHGKIYGENIDQFRSCMSVSDIMELLYGKVARWITNVAAVFLSIGTVSIQFVALGYIVNYFLGISYPYGIITSALIIAIYSAFSGVRAVAFTDIFQFAVIMIAIPVAFSFLYHDVGGYKGIIQSLPEDERNLNIDKNDILLFLSMIFYAVFPLSAGVYIQRFLMCRDSIQLTHCLNVVAVMSWFFTIIICTIGFIFKIKEPGMDTNVVLLHFITHHIPIGFKGLIMSGLLAMMMSTADSWLNNTSIIFVHDIIRKIIPLTERQALVFARTFTFIICIVSAFWAINSKKLLDIGLITANFWVPIISIPLVAGFLKFRTNSKSFMAATLVAIIFANVSGYIVGKLENISLMFGTIGSAIGLFGMHYWQVYQGCLKGTRSQ